MTLCGRTEPGWFTIELLEQVGEVGSGEFPLKGCVDASLGESATSREGWAWRGMGGLPAWALGWPSERMASVVDCRGFTGNRENGDPLGLALSPGGTTASRRKRSAVLPVSCDRLSGDMASLSLVRFGMRRQRGGATRRLAAAERPMGSARPGTFYIWRGRPAALGWD